MDQPQSSKRKRTRALAFVLAALTASACSATSDEQVGSSNARIAGGSVDASHSNVFLLGWNLKEAGALCTATLIAPNLLLTARHCVSPGTGDDHVLCGDSALMQPYPASAFFSTNDALPRDHSPFFDAADVRVPKLGGDTCGYDIALIILKENIAADVSTPAVPRIDRDVTPGEIYTAVGYGVDENGKTNGSRKQLEGLTIACEPGSCGDGVESTEFRGETGICSGDSGGPAFDVDGKVVGVVSRGGPDCSTPVYGTVTAWSDFIIETAKDAAALGGYEPPFWVTTRSSDPPLLVEGGDAGARCDSANACKTDLVCYASSPEDAGHCTASCKVTADCSAGLICESNDQVSVCVAPHGSADETGGCSLAGTRPASPWGVLAGCVGAGLMLSRRRARARRR